MAMFKNRPRRRRTPRDRGLYSRRNLLPKAMCLTMALAVATVIGCASSMNTGTHYGNAATVSNPHAQTTQTLKYMKENAHRHHLPDKYYSEAQIGMGEVTAKRDAARAAEIERDAIFRNQTAHIAARRQSALTNENISLAEAEKLKKEFAAMHRRTAAELAARERETKADAENWISIRTALAKEYQSAQNDLISQAEYDFAQDQARLEKLRTVREATENEGLAALDQMQENARATRARAIATAAALRTEAQAVKEQTAARATDLSKRTGTVRQRSVAKSNRLLAQATASEQNSRARANELEARATALEVQASQKESELKVTTAKSQRQKAQAAYDVDLSNARSGYERAIAEIERFRGDANVTIHQAESDFGKQLGELNAWLKDALAEVGKIRAKADRLEMDAHAEFVKAEATARAKAWRETAAHQDTLAEAQMKKIMAEAETEAARIREQTLTELARKMNAGKVEFEGQTTPGPEQPAELHNVPDAPKVAKVTPRIEPEHVAAYRSALAQVMRGRIRADAQQTALQATHTEHQKKIDAVRTQQLALAAEQNATADALGKKAEAELAEHTAQVDAELATAKSSYTRAIVEAGAFRKEVLAEATNMRAKAKAEVDTGFAQAQAWRKEADVVTNNADAEILAIKAELQATHQRGEAEHNRLVTEATSVQESQSALACQIESEIKTAQQSLQAELTKLDRQLDTGYVIAKADYEETLVLAEVLGRKNEVELARIAAQDELQQAMTRAELERARDELYVNQVKNEAEIDRIVAGALAEREQSVAICDAAEVAARAQADVNTANALAQRRIASAHEEAIKSLFDARLAQVYSERILAKNENFLDQSFHRVNVETALAQARAAREDTRNRLAQLAKRQKQLQTAAMQDWDSRLARHRNQDALQQPREKVMKPVSVGK